MPHQKLRIAIFHNLPASGAKRALFQYARCLAQRGHTLDVYTLDSADQTFLSLVPFVGNTHIEAVLPLRILPARFPVIAQIRNVRRRLRHLQVVERVHQRLADRINAETYDLVFVHNCLFTHVPFLLHYLTHPSVYLCHEPFRQLHEPQIDTPNLAPDFPSDSSHSHPLVGIFQKLDGVCYVLTEPRYQRVYRCNERGNARAATLLLANSYYGRETIYKTYGVFPKVNYLGVDAEHFRPHSAMPKDPIILSVSRIEPIKQHHVVIESVARIPRHLRPTVVIVGTAKDPDYLELLQQFAQNVGVSVQFELSVSEEELIRWYNRAKAVVFVPILEPFGFITLEAMACGTPIIGVKEGGIREVIQHEVTGLLVERDPDDIAAAIQRVLQDEAFAQKLCRAARENVCDVWTWERSCDQLLEHFDSVIRS